MVPLFLVRYLDRIKKSSPSPEIPSYIYIYYRLSLSPNYTYTSVIPTKWQVPLVQKTVVISIDIWHYLIIYIIYIYIDTLRMTCNYINTFIILLYYIVHYYDTHDTRPYGVYVTYNGSFYSFFL